MDWFENWFGSPHYKILYQNRDEFEAQEFVENLIKYLNPANSSKMLDIACGEGRFARQLAEHGFDVTGIDISKESICAAKACESSNLQFFTHDMRLPFYINYFDYSFNFFTSFGYFSHDRDHLSAARAFAASLKPDGLLVIDYLNVEHVMANLVTEETIERGKYTFRIKRRIERNHFIKEINFIDDNNQPGKFTESVAAFTLSDFIRMFKTADMALTGTFGDYQLNDYHPVDSPRLIMTFKKKYA